MLIKYQLSKSIIGNVALNFCSGCRKVIDCITIEKQPYSNTHAYKTTHL